jgi:aspartate/methionine/tyrosine aminotransferase
MGSGCPVNSQLVGWNFLATAACGGGGTPLRAGGRWLCGLLNYCFGWLLAVSAVLEPRIVVKLSTRMDGVAPFQVMAILERARALQAEGRDVIHLEVGEPDFATPKAIVEAGRQALADGHTFYTAAQGLPQLRAAIAGFYQQRYGVTVDARRIIVTPGASGALQIALSLLVNQDDQVLMADPTYPCNRHFVSLLGGEPVCLPVGPDTRYQLLADGVDAWAERTVAAMVASPANPTGTLLTAAELAALSASCKQHGGSLIVDEIYHGLTYGCDAATALAVDPDVFVINSFSKYFQMTAGGWAGWWCRMTM